MHKATVATQEAAAAAGSAAKTAADTRTDNQDSFTKTLDEIQKQSAAMQGAAAAQESQARSSDAALESGINTSRREQRAWLNAPRLILQAEPGVSSRIRVSANLVNTGKTPAVLMAGKSQIQFGPIGAPPSPKSWDVPEGPQVIFPGEVSKSITASFGVFDPGVFDPNTFDTGAAESLPYRNHAEAMYVRLLLEYKDAFGCKHFTEICAFRQFGEPLDTFHSCESGNSIDEDGSDKKCTQQ